MNVRRSASTTSSRANHRTCRLLVRAHAAVRRAAERASAFPPGRGRGGRGGAKAQAEQEDAPVDLDDQMNTYFSGTEHGMSSQLEEYVALQFFESAARPPGPAWARLRIILW